MNKKDNIDEEAYYEQFNFLKNSHSTRSDLDNDSYVKEVPRVRGAVTVDQHKNNNLSLTTGVKSVMEDDMQTNFGESLIMRKTDAQKMIESPDMNKKMRTQIDYKEALKGSHHHKKSIQDEISFKESKVDMLSKREDKDKIIYEEMKKNHLADTNKEVLKINNPILENQSDSKLKVYKVKKIKTINRDGVINDNEKLDKISHKELKINDEGPVVPKSNTSFKSYVYLSSSLMIGGVFLVKLFKKLKK